MNLTVPNINLSITNLPGKNFAWIFSPLKVPGLILAMESKFINIPNSGNPFVKWIPTYPVAKYFNSYVNSDSPPAYYTTIETLGNKLYTTFHNAGSFFPYWRGYYSGGGVGNGATQITFFTVYNFQGFTGAHASNTIWYSGSPNSGASYGRTYLMYWNEIDGGTGTTVGLVLSIGGVVNMRVHLIRMMFL